MIVELSVKRFEYLYKDKRVYGFVQREDRGNYYVVRTESPDFSETSSWDDKELADSRFAEDKAIMDKLLSRRN